MDHPLFLPVAVAKLAKALSRKHRHEHRNGTKDFDVFHLLLLPDSIRMVSRNETLSVSS